MIDTTAKHVAFVFRVVIGVAFVAIIYLSGSTYGYADGLQAGRQEARHPANLRQAPAPSCPALAREVLRLAREVEGCRLVASEDHDHLLDCRATLRALATDGGMP